MNPRYRSFSGALIAIFAVPVFLGLTACLPAVFPVPVGNPEKSRIDPDITGVWFDEDEEAFYMFQAYDKRTWILGVLDLYPSDSENCVAEDRGAADENSDTEEAEIEPSPYDLLMTDLRNLGSDCFEGEYLPGVMKIWRTKLGGEWFMTWEPLMTFTADTGFQAGEWIVFRIDKSSKDQFSLHWIASDHPAWDLYDNAEEKDVKQRDVEKIIRKNAKDPSFYDESEGFTYQRVLPEHYELIEDFIENNW